MLPCGKHFIDNNLEYYGIDIVEEYIEAFHIIAPFYTDKILLKNFLLDELPWKNLDAILFSWSSIAEFSSDEGQYCALMKSRKLLRRFGTVLIDIPLDIVNTFDDVTMGHFNIHERYNLLDYSLYHRKSHNYETFTKRNRSVLELIAQ